MKKIFLRHINVKLAQRFVRTLSFWGRAREGERAGQVSLSGVALAMPVRLYYKAAHWPEYLASSLDLGLRLFLANVFFKSGLTKILSWDSTLYLFSDVYDVPLLQPEYAAWLATGAELGLSVLLAIGLFGRFAASGLFILNIVAVISYSELSECGISHHLYWGLLLAVLLVISRKAWSIDTLLEKRLQASAPA